MRVMRLRGRFGIVDLCVDRRIRFVACVGVGSLIDWEDHRVDSMT